jgi:hypothetical protein
MFLIISPHDLAALDCAFLETCSFCKCTPLTKNLVNPAYIKHSILFPSERWSTFARFQTPRQILFCFSP